MIYFDNAATTETSQGVIKQMTNVARYTYGNPSSSHYLGIEAYEIIENARETIANHINAMPSEIYFTSGGTESNNIAYAIGSRYGKTAGSTIEHPSNLRADIKLPVDKEGFLQIDPFRRVIADKTLTYITTMLVNNETGTILPIKYYADTAHRYNPELIFHTDATQAIGHMKIDVKELGVDMLSASAHKFHGPKGIGFLYISNKLGSIYHPLMIGGEQEKGVRPGTENVPGIAGMAEAIKEIDLSYDVTFIRDYLRNELSKIEGTRINGSLTSCVNSIVNCSFEGVRGEQLVEFLNANNIAVSSGSACNSENEKPSHVLTAMGLSNELANGSLRLSISKNTTMDEAKRVAEVVAEGVKCLKMNV